MKKCWVFLRPRHYLSIKIITYTLKHDFSPHQSLGRAAYISSLLNAAGAATTIPSVQPRHLYAGPRRREGRGEELLGQVWTLVVLLGKGDTKRVIRESAHATAVLSLHLPFIITFRSSKTVYVYYLHVEIQHQKLKAICCQARAL